MSVPRSWKLGFVAVMLGTAGCGPELAREGDGDAESGFGGENDTPSGACSEPPDECLSLRFGTDRFDTVSGFAFDGRGGLYIGGSTQGGFPGHAETSSFDAYITKACADGTREWTTQFGGNDVDSVNGLTVGAEGELYVAGQIASFSGAPSFGSADGFLASYTPAGEQLWFSVLGSSGSDVVADIAIDGSGQLFVAGYTSGALGPDASLGGVDAFLAMYSLDGELLWVRQFGSEDDDRAGALAIDAQGYIAVAGSTKGATSGGASAGGTDVFVARYGEEGGESWFRQFGTDRDDTGFGVAATATGEIYVAGTVGSDRGLDGAVSLGGTDAFLIKYDADGTKRWSSQYGSDASDSSVGVAVRPDGNVVASGWTYGALAGESSAGISDLFVVEYEPDGRGVSTRQVGTAEGELGQVLVLDGGRTYIGGRVGPDGQQSDDALVRQVCD